MSIKKTAILLSAVCVFALTACGANSDPFVSQPAGTDVPSPDGQPSSSSVSQESAAASNMPEESFRGSEAQDGDPQTAPASSADQVDRDGALAIALSNAGVSEEDAYNVKVERDGDNGIDIFDIEFETDYGDYDFEVAVDGGRIVGADYEVDEEWVYRQTESPISIEEAESLVRGKASDPDGEIHIRQEGGDGRPRYEGSYFSGDMEYEFEIDPNTGIIFDWNADLRR